MIAVNLITYLITNLVKHVSEGDIRVKIIITRSVCFCLFSQGFLSVCNPVAILEQVDELMNTGELAGIPSQVRPRCFSGMRLFSSNIHLQLPHKGKTFFFFNVTALFASTNEIRHK